PAVRTPTRSAPWSASCCRLRLPAPARVGPNRPASAEGGQTGPPRSRQSLTDSFFECGGDWGTPKAFTLTPGPREASTDSFRNHRPLELGKHAHHLKHRLPGGGRGVEPLLAQE